METTCPACGATVSFGPGGTIQRCPACRRYFPADELRFDNRPPPLPDRSVAALARKRARATLSPTARAFLLVILVVAAMAWLVRLLKVVSPKPPDAAAAARSNVCADGVGTPGPGGGAGAGPAGPSGACAGGAPGGSGLPQAGPAAAGSRSGSGQAPDPALRSDGSAGGLPRGTPAGGLPAAAGGGPASPRQPGSDPRAAKGGASASGPDSQPASGAPGGADPAAASHAPGTTTPPAPERPAPASTPDAPAPALEAAYREVAERAARLRQPGRQGLPAPDELRVYADILAALQVSESGLGRLAAGAGVSEAARQEVAGDLAVAQLDAPYYVQAMADHASAMGRLAVASAQALDASGRFGSALAEFQSALAQPSVSPWDRQAAALETAAEALCLAAQARGAPAADLRALRARLHAVPGEAVLVRCERAAGLVADAAQALAGASPGGSRAGGVQAIQTRRAGKRRQASDNVGRLAAETEAMAASLALVEP